MGLRLVISEWALGWALIVVSGKGSPRVPEDWPARVFMVEGNSLVMLTPGDGEAQCSGSRGAVTDLTLGLRRALERAVDAMNSAA